MFGQTATVAHQTRLISADMRTRTEALQRECERIVTMLRSSDGSMESKAHGMNGEHRIR